MFRRFNCRRFKYRRYVTAGQTVKLEWELNHR